MTAKKSFPLLRGHTLDSVMAYRGATPITVRRFLADVAYLAAQLPRGQHVLNVCSDRYRFTVGLAAALVTGKSSLLPSTLTSETVRHLRQFAPDAFCLADEGAPEIDLPHHAYSDNPEADVGLDRIPEVDATHIVAYVFTSGSTGMPVPHVKTWGSLVSNISAAAAQLGITAERRHALVATVPPQHMYGFESSVLLALLGGCSFYAGRPFYPADISAALESVPQPRALITTPFHLHALLDGIQKLPAMDFLISATAPLSLALAQEAESRCGAPLMEIYGCTETGQIAMRRSVEGNVWYLMGETRLTIDEDDVAWAFGGHVLEKTALNDVVELLSDTSFLLHGRSADLVNIAGKRTSLSYLNQQLNDIPGVVDGAFFMPDHEKLDGVTRLVAFVVAPTMNSSMLMGALQERMDAAFLPRPLIFLESLPRNATGKLPRNVLSQLLEDHRHRITH